MARPILLIPLVLLAVATLSMALYRSSGTHLRPPPHELLAALDGDGLPLPPELTPCNWPSAASYDFVDQPDGSRALRFYIQIALDVRPLIDEYIDEVELFIGSISMLNLQHALVKHYYVRLLDFGLKGDRGGEVSVADLDYRALVLGRQKVHIDALRIAGLGIQLGATGELAVKGDDMGTVAIGTWFDPRFTPTAQDREATWPHFEERYLVIRICGVEYGFAQ